MILGIDGNEANVSKKLGISEYAYELLSQFKILQTTDVRFLIYLKDVANTRMPAENAAWKYRVIGPKRFWTQARLPFDLYFHTPKPSVFFSPTHYAPRFAPMPVAISIMDLSFLRYPQLFREQDLYKLKHWTAYSAKKAARIFTISQASKNDIIAEYGVAPESVIVTYPGIKPIETLHPHIYPMNELQAKFSISEKFLLFVGTLQPRKNITRLIEAYAASDAAKEHIDLVIVGKKGWLYEEILAAPEKYGVAEQVKFLEFVDDEQLALLYQQALFFILPSLYEGFGLPVLEAMKYGCPVITSKTSSLPEAGGDAAMYVDPDDTQDIVTKMNELLHDSHKRKSMSEKGKEHIKQFSWKKTAKTTLAVLQSLAQS
jgi:glycosyltransferase involved in cell wall biosynthesis